MTVSERIRLVRVRSVSTPHDRLTPTPTDGDQSNIATRCNRWRKSFRDTIVAYPAIVLAIPQAAKWVREHGCEVHAHSPQTIAFSMSAGVSPAHVIFHCRDATGRTITDALGVGIGQFIVDSESAAVKLGACSERPQRVLIDVTCGQDSGLVDAVVGEEMLTLTGLYSDADNPEVAVQSMLEHIADVRSRRGPLLCRIGVAVRDEQSMSPEVLADAICQAVEDGCARFRLPRPALTVLPDWIALTHDI
jgi:Pyridoxal-dependent decarboxylase, pyridoxal binding domain